jgi:hypothetical protein
VTGTALTLAGGNLTGGINSARGNITQHATTMDFFATTSPDILDGTGSAVTITACVNAPQAGATRKFYPIVATVLTHGATFDIAGNANLTAAAGDCWEIEAKTVSTYRVKAVKEDGTAIAVLGATEQALTGYYLPAAGSAYQDCYRAGFLPSWFNQQWGGAQWGTLPDGSFGSVATGNVQDDTATSLGIAGRYYASQGFIVSETVASPVVWVKVYKSGNPANALTVSIRANSGGAPTGADLGSGTVAAKLVTSKTDGEWYQVTISGTYAANTQYHLVLTQSATDASNYYSWKATSAKKYPHGYLNDGTSTPIWTPNTAYAYSFLIQNPTANSIIQSAGMFDYKLAFNPGTPVNQSRSVAQPLANFYDGKTCSVLYRGTYAISTNVWDFCYGLDHDRITLTINASGYPVLSIYESDRTLAQVTGTGSVASGNHDVGIRIRTMGDGADYATLYVDGVSVGTPLTAQTFTMDAAMVQLGTCRLGDGFGIIPAWTNDSQFTALPSTMGWTGTASLVTEANAFSIQNNKLYQNKTAFDAAGAGSYYYYSRTAPTAFMNATGWTVALKLRVPTNTNTATSGGGGCYFSVVDGSKIVRVNVHEYFLYIGSTGTPDFYIQGDFKSQDHVFTLQGKGSDYYLFIDGKLAVDGTGKLTSASATNNVFFGDGTSTASETADAIWSYVKYYQGGMLLPTAATSTCSEFAHWSGDKSALYASLWNSGSPVSVKQLCGVPRNYQFEQVVQREVRRGVTSGPTVSSTTPSQLVDMECYVIGSSVEGKGEVSASNGSNNSAILTYSYLDGILATTQYQITQTTLGQPGTLPIVIKPLGSQLGLHKAEARMACSGGTTATAEGLKRTLTVEARS